MSGDAAPVMRPRIPFQLRGQINPGRITYNGILLRLAKLASQSMSNVMTETTLQKQSQAGTNHHPKQVDQTLFPTHVILSQIVCSAGTSTTALAQSQSGCGAS